jgi:hypothetical protein
MADTDTLIATIRAERGAKYDETGQCISSYNRSIVFLPRSAQPDEVIRVCLIPIEGKVDKGGRVMYRAEFAPPDLSMECKNTITAEARKLREGQALPREQGEAILRVRNVARVSSYNWYYFCDDEVFGSRFSPAALVAFEFMPCASGVGLVELTAWLAVEWYFTESQERGQTQIPEISENALVKLEEQTAKGEPVLSVRIT